MPPTKQAVDEALRHVRAAELLLFPYRHESHAGKRWRRTLIALGEARGELEHGRDTLPALDDARARVVGPES